MYIVDLEENDLKIMSEWKYEDKYSIYNFPTLEIMYKENWSITNETKRKNQFKKIVDENNFIGYFRIQEFDDKIILGLGMNPCFCGKGNGKLFMNTIINYLKKNNKIIELEVREFNKRAIKCYENVGFEVVDKIMKESDTFLTMQLKNE